jgi:hypothetical protein
MICRLKPKKIQPRYASSMLINKIMGWGPTVQNRQIMYIKVAYMYCFVLFLIEDVNVPVSYKSGS